MVSINTNLSSFLVKQQLASSTKSLNQAIERMTTGFKVNHASDNAANYSIIQNMNKDISAYDIAADNVAMGSDFAATADDALALVNTHMQRIRDLLSQASNGTYGDASRQAIQAEVDSRLDEINRIFKSTEFNGIQLFNSAILPSTLNINISELNLKAGSFDVNTGGSNFTVNLTNDDSLYSIIAKLNAIGVDADFNDESGVFTVEIENGNITDHGTGFVSVLGLDKTDGYLAEDLKTTEVYTILESANANTQLSAAGITDGSFTIIDSEGHETYDVISVDATIDELFNKLWTHQIAGSINSNGVVTFTSTSGNRIGGALAEQLGIDVDVVDTVYTGLTVNTTNTLTHSFLSNANANTTLDKLGVQAGENLIVKDTEGNNLYSFTADNSSIKNTTLGELFNDIVEAGYLSNASVNNGVVSINSEVNNYVTGSIADRFGIKIIQNDNASTTGITQTSTNAVTFNETSFAANDTTLAKLGITAGETFIINNNEGEELYKYTADNISIQNTTIGDFLNGLVSEGYLTSANITDGVISLSSNVNNYATGTIANRLKIGVKTTTQKETILYDQTSSSPVTYVNTITANNTSTLGELGILAGETLSIKNNNGENLYTYTANSSDLQNTTIMDLFNNFVFGGFLSSADMSDGIISVSSNINNYITGSIADRLGIGVNTQNISETHAIAQTSSSAVSYSKTTSIDATTTLGQIGIQEGDQLIFKNSNNEVIHTYETDSSSLDLSIYNLLNFYAGINLLSDVSINNGIISVRSDEYNYITGSIADRLGIGYELADVTITAPIEQTSSDIITYTRTGPISGDISLTGAGLHAGDTLDVRNNDGNVVYSYEISESDAQNKTINNLFNYLKDSGYLSEYSVSNGVISISSDQNYYITGDIADSLGIGVNSTDVWETVAVETTSTSQVKYIGDVYASYYTSFETLNLPTSGTVNVYNEVGQSVGSFTLASDATIYDFINGINSANPSAYAYIYNGVISISNGYITGNIANAMNLSYTIDSGVYKSSDSKELTYQEEQVLSYNTNLSDLGLNNASFTMNDNRVISLSSSDNIYSAFSNNFLNVTINNGTISINGDKNNYIKSMDSALANALKINVGNGYTYTGTTNTYHSNTDSRLISATGEYKMSETTKLSDFNLNSASITMNDGTVISLSSSDSVYEKLQATGVNVNLENGILTLTGSSTKQIINMTPTLANALNIQVGEGHTYNVSEHRFNVNTDSTASQILYTDTLSSSTTLKDLGLSSASFTLDNNTVVNIGENDSIFSKLNSAGLGVEIENGILTISDNGNHYLKSMTPALASKLKIQAGEGYSYEINNRVLHTNTDSQKQNIYNTVNLTETTTLKDLGMNSASFTMNNNNVIRISANDIVYDKLRNAGLNVSISDGKINISAKNGNYLKSMNSDLVNVLKIEAGEGKTYEINTNTIHSNTNSSVQKITNTSTITTTTTLDKFGVNSATFTMNDNTVVTIKASDTVYSKLQNAGLDVRIGLDGKISVSGNSEHYIKSMSSTLSNILKIQAGEGKSYEINHDITYSNSNSKTQTYLSTATLTSANSSTYRMSDWGLNTNSKIYTNNVAITINKSDKISDVISKLDGAGIRVSVNDATGTLKIENSNNNYITSIDTALKNVLGIEVGEGKTYNSTTVTHRSDTTSKILHESINHTISRNATESTLLKDFNKDGLNMEGDLVFDFADGQKTVKITSKDTISSLIDKLKNIGIKAIFKDQALSISGNKNSVLLLDNSSGTTSYLAELLGLEYKNKLDGITSSNDLNALADSIYAEKFNTPNFLCIQAGISGNEHDMITMDMRLALGRVTFKTYDSESASKGLNKIDQLIAKITAKQTEYGAFSNRMESAAESIAVSLQNLVSSKSTLQDADIAVESSKYIRAQILQQAAATLLATANQIPAIAIQLI